METPSRAEEYFKITKATIDIDYNILFKNIAELLEIRKKICISMLSCEDDNTYKELNEVYNQIQSNLKILLNI